MKWINFLIVLIAMTYTTEIWAQQCTVSATSVNFGGYDISAVTPLNATGSINVTCTPSTSTVVKLDPGINSGGSFNPRKMSGAGGYIDYNLYTDAANIMIWGDGTGNTVTQAGGNNLVVYGRIPSLQKVKPGTYSDFVTIILDW